MVKNCLDKRNTCGTTVASACVPYTGPELDNVDYDTLPCNPNINDIVEDLDGVITSIKTAINIEGLELKCLEDCNCGDLTIKETFQIIINKLCEIVDRVKSLEDQMANISTTKFTVDLSCFANPCFNSATNEYSLLEIINLLLTELCNLKNAA